jgi:hypothetical protein
MNTPTTLLLCLLIVAGSTACRCCPGDKGANSGAGTTAEGGESMHEHDGDSHAAPKAPKEARPAVWRPLADGHDSAVNELSFVVCRDAKAWNALWAKHKSNVLPVPSAPEIDWSKEMVVGLVLGLRPTAGYSVAVEGVEIVDGRMEFRAHEAQPDPDMAQAQMITCPYALCRVERFQGPVDLVLKNN